MRESVYQQSLQPRRLNFSTSTSLTWDVFRDVRSARFDAETGPGLLKDENLTMWSEESGEITEPIVIEDNDSDCDSKSSAGSQKPTGKVTLRLSAPPPPSILAFSQQRYQALLDGRDTIIGDSRAVDSVEEARSVRHTAARKVLDIFLRLEGCGRKRHRDHLDEHLQEQIEAGLDCQGVRETSPDGLPDILQNHPSTIADARGSLAMPNKEVWKCQYYGRDGLIYKPKTLCPHEDEPKEQTNREASFNYDSFLGFATDLGFIRTELYIEPYPSMLRNIEADLHMKS